MKIKIIIILLDCTAKFLLETKKWSKVGDSPKDMGPGGDIIKGKDHTLYYIGGVDVTTRKKSRAIFEFSDTGWYHWPNELIVDDDALNAWGVTELGSNFCANKTNVTKAVSYEEGWVLNVPAPKSGFCIKNLYKGESTHEECEV